MSSKTPSTGPAPRLLDDILGLQLRERHYSELGGVLVVVGQSGWVLGLDAAVEPSEAIRQLRRGPGVDAFASFLLRLLAADRQLVDDSPLRAHVALFLDRQYGDVLRPYYERPPRGGTHDVLSSFQAVAPALESEAADLIIGLKGLSGLTAFRQGLMRLIGGTPGRVVIRPFLPEEALGSNLTDFFATAEAMRDSEDDLNVMHGRLEEQAHVLESQARSFATTYARQILEPMVTAVVAASRQKLDLRRPPASIGFQGAARPLPLLEPGATATARFDVLNEGASPANDLRLTLESEPTVVLLDREIRLGDVPPGSSVPAAVDFTVGEAGHLLEIRVSGRWVNRDHSIAYARGVLTFVAHATDIDWDRMDLIEPFAPYPVEDPRDLVGRGPYIRRLKARTEELPLANLYVTGQRRVGKTSLVRTLTSELANADQTFGAGTFALAFVELGEARHIDEKETIGSLGRKLAERAVASIGLADAVAIPPFTDSLAPLTDMVDAVRQSIPDVRFLFVIDEFDELHHDLYRRGGPGDALFLPMRSLAQKPYVGWLLVGGEKMPFIQDEQATRLNTFTGIDVGYLPLHGESRDIEQEFSQLVRRPLATGFQVEDEAVRAIHVESAGNPHFAKAICTGMFELACQARNAYLTADEVQTAAERAIRAQDVELFCHFWEDGIFEVEEKARRRELQRRVYLQSFAEVMRTARSVDAAGVLTECDRRGFRRRDATQLQQEFINRDILVEDSRHNLRVKVPLFGRWLETEGVYKLAPRGLSEEFHGQIVEENEVNEIRPEEIRRLLDRWGGFKYRGEGITRDQVESWLVRFDTAVDRRLMFRLVERMRLISDAEIHEGFRRLQRLVAREVKVPLRRGQRVLSHLFVSAVGAEGSSGQAFVYRYRQANNISGNNIVPSGSLASRLKGAAEVQSVVLIDDFIGTGHTLIAALESLASDVSQEALAEREWYLFALSGTPEGVRNVQESVPGQALRLRVELAYPLEPRHQPFGRESTVFSDPVERATAEQVARSAGERLWPSWPIGYRDGAVLVCFPENCQNNVPPVFWSDADGWLPLFRRTAR